MHYPKLLAKMLLFDVNGQVLLVRRSNTAPRRALEWEFPGGVLDYREDPKATALRELQEETGIEAKDAHYLFAGTSPEFYYTGVFFYGYTDSQEVTLSYEHDRYKWVHLNEAMAEIKVLGYKKALSHYQQYIKRGYKVKVSTKAIITSGQGVLLLKRADDDPQGPGYWDLPGGGMEPGETIYESMKRELQEETKLIVNDLQLVFGHTEARENDKQLRIRLGIHATTKQHEPTLSHEHSQYKWIPKGEAYDFAKHPNWPGWGEFVKIFG